MKSIKFKTTAKVVVGAEQVETWEELIELRKRFSEDYLLQTFNLGWGMTQIADAMVEAELAE